jgi:UDP-GlcNAc:undecaprenyl-phosphate/decaprenyl-phosphate GlcNAc-1-phosphate transferase
MIFDLSGGGLFRLVWSCILPFVSVLVLVPLLVQLDRRKHLSAIPNSRSSHMQTVPSIGGVGIFISVFIGSLAMLNIMNGPETGMLLLGFVLLFLIGIKDDIIDSSPYFKLAGQLIVALSITEGAGLKINSLYGFFGIYEMPYPVCSIISVLLIMTIVNAINFIDGIDGLAALVGISGIMFSSVAFYQMGELFYLAFSGSMIFALLGFLKFNFSSREKVFMGDTGSLLIGMALSVFILKIWGLHARAEVFPASPFWVFSIALLPVFDFFRVFLIRVTNGISPLRADRNHVHHVLVDHCGFSHKQAAFFLSLLTMANMGMSYLIAYSSFMYLILIWYASLFLIYVSILHHIQKVALKQAAAESTSKQIAHKSLLNGDLRVLARNYRRG